MESAPMKKQQPALRIENPKALAQPADRCWHNGGDVEIQQYAKALRKAGRALIEKLDVDRNPKTAWDACPVVLLYREATELHLKALAGEGSNFLPSPTDHITLFQTHSLRWLAQIVCRIIRAVKRESDFKCEGVASLAEFSALVNKVEAFSPIPKVVQSIRTAGPDSITQLYRTFDIVQFGRKLDALLDLLDVTADSLAATWNQQVAVPGEVTFHAGDDIKPTIQ